MAGNIHLNTSFGGLLCLLIVKLWLHDCLRWCALKILIKLWLRLVVLRMKNVVVILIILAEVGRMASAAIIELLLTWLRLELHWHRILVYWALNWRHRLRIRHERGNTLHRNNYLLLVHWLGMWLAPVVFGWRPLISSILLLLGRIIIKFVLRKWVTLKISTKLTIEEAGAVPLRIVVMHSLVCWYKWSIISVPHKGRRYEIWATIAGER